MTVIGLVGRIAAGKSTVARAFERHGAAIIDADRIAHAVLTEPAVIGEIVARFGTGVLGEGGAVNRPALAREVFGPTPAHDQALRDLEGIVHPRIRGVIEARLPDAGDLPAGKQDGGLVVLDVPLLMQAGWDRRCDRIVEVACDEPTRQQRLDARGWPAGQRAARERAWQRNYRPPSPEKTVRVDASGDPSYTCHQVEAFLADLSR